MKKKCPNARSREEKHGLKITIYPLAKGMNMLLFYFELQQLEVLLEVISPGLKIFLEMFHTFGGERYFFPFLKNEHFSLWLICLFRVAMLIYGSARLSNI